MSASYVPNKVQSQLYSDPTRQSCYIDARYTSSIHWYNVFVLRIDRLENIFQLAGFRIFTASQFFESDASFVIVLHNCSYFGNGGNGIFLHHDKRTVHDLGSMDFPLTRNTYSPFPSGLSVRIIKGIVSPSSKLPAAILPMTSAS